MIPGADVLLVFDWKLSKRGFLCRFGLSVLVSQLGVFAIHSFDV